MTASGKIGTKFSCSQSSKIPQKTTCFLYRLKPYQSSARKAIHSPLDDPHLAVDDIEMLVGEVFEGLIYIFLLI